MKASDGSTLDGDGFQITMSPAPNISDIGASVAYNSHPSYQEHLVVWARRDPDVAGMSVWGQRVKGNQLIGSACQIFPTAGPLPDLDMPVMPVVVYNPDQNEYAVVTWHGGQVKMQRIKLNSGCYTYSQVFPRLAYNAGRGRALIVWEDHYYDPTLGDMYAQFVFKR